MSVLLGDRKESKFEAITYSIELHDMLLSLMQRSFGVKEVDDFVRKAYAYGDISEETFSVYREIMNSFKKRVSQHASCLLDWHMTGSCILECRILTVGV